MDISTFKSDAWLTRTMSKAYRKRVNKHQGLDAIDLETFVNEVEQYVKPLSRVLDAGCGSGALSVPLAKAGYKVTGLDISQNMIDVFKAQAKNLSIRTQVGDLRNLPGDLGLFDGIVTRWVLPHFPDWPILIGHLVKHLNSGGFLIFEMPNTEHVTKFWNDKDVQPTLYGYNHSKSSGNDAYYYYSHESLEALEQLSSAHNCRLVSSKPYGLLTANIAIAAASGDEYPSMREDLHRLLGKNDSLYKLLGHLEKSITPHIDRSLVHSSLVVFQKNSD